MIKIKTLVLISASLLIGVTASFADWQRNVENYAQIIKVSQKQEIEQPMPQAKVVQSKALGWGSWALNTSGDLLRGLGDKLRQPEDRNTDLGKLTHAAKQLTCDAIQAKTGLSFSTKAFTGIGNAFRWLGSKIKTVEEPQTKTQALLDAAGIHYTSQTNEDEFKFKQMSAALVQSGEDDAELLKLAKAAKARGHDVSSKVFDNHAEEVAKKFLETEKLTNDSAAKKSLTIRLGEFLERTGLATSLENIKAYVSNLYNKLVNAFKG